MVTGGSVVTRDIADWLMDKYPESMAVRDNVSTVASLP